jgi:TonB family protein
MCRLAACIAIAFILFGSQDASYTPARLRSGKIPPIPATAVGGGEVLLDLDVSAEGAVTRATPLRSTPPFTELLSAAVRDWEFFPARQAAETDTAGAEPRSRVAAPSNVLVAAVFRPPSLRAPTLGEPPKDTSNSNILPFPAAMIPPLFPPKAASNGAVLLEAHVTATGLVDDVGVINSAPPFDDAAINAVRQWRFRPARMHGAPVSTYVYVVVGFRVPVG